jgi:GAF domain-containing protein
VDEVSRLRAAVAAAMRVDGSPEAPAFAVSAVVARALPGDGAAITLMPSDETRETLAVTDEVIAAIERAQFTLGEGPSLDALTTGRPVLVSDLGDPMSRAAWPGLTGRLADLPVGALFAFPMQLGATVIGVALSYRAVPGDLSRDEVTFALRAVDIVTMALLRIREGTATGDEDDWLGDGVLGAREVHQATGMVMVQLGGVAATIAFARMRGHAFVLDHSIEEVAGAILAHRLVFDPDEEPTT